MLATVLNMNNDFTQARFKLILLYLIIIGSVITLFSLLIVYQAHDSFSDPAVVTDKNLAVNRDAALSIAQEQYPSLAVEETEYEIEDGKLYLTISFTDEVEVKVNLVTGEIKEPDRDKSFWRTLTDDFDEMVVLIGLCVFLLSALLSVYVANKTLAPIARSMQKQKRFVSDAAHELRNPLAAMHARLESVLRTANTTFPKDVLTDVLGETKHLINMSEGLLALERGEVQSKTSTEVPVSHTVRDVLGHLQFDIEAKHINVHTHMDEGLVLFDRSDLETLVYNILHNAIKFTPQNGSVTLTFKLKRLTITDTGIGIGKEHLPHLFDRFYKADVSRTHEGNGLGLALVKTLAEKYGATISVASTQGQGTQFVIDFT
jgi:signal transduction histidine kinase